MRRAHDAEARRADDKLDSRASLVKLAVGVQQAGRGALDDETMAAAQNHVGCATDGAAEEVPGQRQRVPQADRRDDAEIELAVVQQSVGADARVVAILVGVGDGQRERAEGVAAAIVLDGAVLRGPLAKGAGARGEVAGETAAREGVEALRDLGFEADAGRGEKGMAVGESAVDQAGPSAKQDVQRVFGGAVNTQVPAEAVAGTAGHETERSGGADKGARDFVHGAVAPDRHDEFAAVHQGALREFGGVTTALREDKRGPVAGGKRLNGGQGAGGAAGAGIEDEAGFQRRI